MSETLKPDTSFGGQSQSQHGGDLQIRSRSPHPYHHQNADLPHPAERLLRRSSSTASAKSDRHNNGHHPFPAFSKDSTPGSDSGTDADDEHFLKGLPAPRVRLHKGLRGQNEPLSGTSTPLLSPAIFDEEGRNGVGKPKHRKVVADAWHSSDGFRRTKVLLRRSLECALIGSSGLMLWADLDVRPIIIIWRRGRCIL
jgi:hypothetical protein